MSASYTIIPASNVSDVEGEVLRSVLGYEFHTATPIWKLSKDNSLNMQLVMERTPEQYKSYVKRLLQHYATTFSGGTTLSVANSLYVYFSRTNGTLDTHQLISFKSSLDGDYDHLHRLRPFLRRWLAFGYPGVSKDLVAMVDSWKLPGGAKGEAVKRLDSTEGPLSDFELSAYNEGAIFAYEGGRLTLYDLAMCLLVSFTGRRPVQITHLKCKDLVEVISQDGISTYFLHIPRAKQEGGEFRDEFKTFQLARELYEVLSSHRNKLYATLADNDYSLSDVQKGLVPLFPAKRKWLKYSYGAEFTAALSGESLHARTDIVNLAIKRAVFKVGIKSHRTDKELNVFAKRFRYTLGTRAAREGMSRYIIAELLDHSDTQHVGVYTLNVPEHLKKIDEALGFQLARYAQAFSGNLVDSELDALRGADPASRVKHRKCSVGTCGSFAYCGMNAPRPCYTCVSFQPWVDGAHEEFYLELLEEREQCLDETGDLAVAAVLDRTIVAVAEVIQKCDDRKREMINE